MTDANLVRVLSRADRRHRRAGAVCRAVEQGAAAIRRAMTALAEQGRRYAIVDAVSDAHLLAIGEAAAAHALITGGSGVAMGLPENFRRAGLLPERADPGALPTLAGAAAVLAGSCSRATLGQIGFARERVPVFELDPLATPDAAALAARRVAWAAGRLGATPIVIAASAPPDKVAAVQQTLGRDAAGALVEDAMARIAAALVARGVRRLVVAGGETAGAVVARLGVRSLRIGGEIDPGVPWTYAEGGNAPLLLALKSGNFGARDFFLKAFDAPGASSSSTPWMEHGRASTEGARMTEIATRRLLVELAASLFARGFFGRQRRQHQRAAGRRLSDHADQFQPRPARSGAAVAAGCGVPPRRRRQAVEGSVHAPRLLHGAQRRGRGGAPALDDGDRGELPDRTSTRATRSRR